MYTLIKPILIATLFLQNITYANIRRVYVGVHQSYGILKDALRKDRHISGDRSGLLEKSFPNMLTFHYQHSKEWGITAIPSAFAPLNTEKGCYNSSGINMTAKKKLLQQGYCHIYFPIGIWGAISKAIPKACNNQKSFYIIGGGVVLGGLGLQLSLNYILIDIAYERLWSFRRMAHANFWTINIGIKLLDFSKNKKLVAHTSDI